MKRIEIKITGAGSVDEIVNSLESFISDIQMEDCVPYFEDGIISGIISEED